jgi:hypothetical protein
MALLQRIRQKIVDRSYILSGHAEDELWNDDLERADAEHAILHRQIDRRFTEDPRGTRFRLEGRRVMAGACALFVGFTKHMT